MSVPVIGNGPDPVFAVTSTAKNCAWARHCIYSVERQTYPYRWHTYFAADRVTEQIANATYAGGAHGLYVCYSPKTVVENVFTFWRSLPPSTVIVWVDGDDWLLHPRVLAELATVYRKLDPWLTYGSFRCTSPAPWSMQNFGKRYGSVPPRQDAWRASHLKTFRAGLVQQVKEEDLRRKDGSWTEYVTDQVFMLPMLEMAGERYEVIGDDLLVYNLNNAFMTVNKDQKKADAEYAELVRIRSLPPYARLEKRPW